MAEFTGEWTGGGSTGKVFNSYVTKLTLPNFKVDPTFATIIGNDTRNKETALKFYSYIKSNNPEFLEESNLKKFIVNDTLGNPKLYTFEGITISPGTLVFMKVLSDIATFKDVKSIVEIGSGYGGQAQIIKASLDVDYTCIDIPGVLGLCSSYLGELGTSATFIPSTDVKEVSADLVISNYALSELDETGVQFYLDHVVKNCKYFYMAVGNYSPGMPRHAYLMEKLGEMFDLTIEKENPKTSGHNNIFVLGERRD
tara:strand:+ start:786 stop:1550 length:765 start_codon:yes stop_codon:yes gene_type:complete